MPSFDNLFFPQEKISATEEPSHLQLENGPLLERKSAVENADLIENGKR